MYCQCLYVLIFNLYILLTGNYITFRIFKTVKKIRAGRLFWNFFWDRRFFLRLRAIFWAAVERTGVQLAGRAGGGRSLGVRPSAAGSQPGAWVRPGSKEKSREQSPVFRSFGD
jgi:hypothetical protein